MTFCCSMHIFELDGVGASISRLPMYAAYGATKAGVILPHLYALPPEPYHMFRQKPCGAHSFQHLELLARRLL